MFSKFNTKMKVSYHMQYNPRIDLPDNGTSFLVII